MNNTLCTKLLLFLVMLSPWVVSGAKAQILTLENNRVCNDPLVGPGTLLSTSSGDLQSLNLLANAGNITNGDMADYAVATLNLGLAGNTTLAGARDAVQYFPANNRVGFLLAEDTGTVGLLSAALLNNLRIETYRNGVLQESATVGGTIPLETGALLGTSPKQIVSFITSKDFDEVRLVTAGATLSVSTLRIYYAFEEPAACAINCTDSVTDTDGDGIPDCRDSCPFASTIDTDGDGIFDACDTNTASVTVSKTSNAASPAAINDLVTFTITVTKDSLTATGLVITDTFTPGLSYVSHVAPIGTDFDPVTGLWTVGSALSDPTEDQLVLTVVARVDSIGISINTASVIALNELNFSTITSSSACVSVPIVICEGDSVELSAPSGLSSYQWYNGDVAIEGATDSIYVAAVSGSYRFNSTTSQGCASGNCCPIIITVNPAPVAAIAGELEICAGGSTTLTASGGSSFLWSVLGGALADTTASITVSPLVTTTYTVIALNGTCSDTAFVTVNVNPSITASIAGELEICAGGSTTLTASGGSSFLWSVLGGALADTTASITVSPLVTTTYTVIALNGTCSDTAFVTVNVNPSITASIAGELEICAGGSTTLTASGGSSFLWSVLGGALTDTTASITVSPLVTTTYTLVALNGTCADTTEVTVNVNPSITASIAGELEICAGGSTTLTASGGSSFLWSILGSPLADTTASITVSPLVTTTYTVVALNGTCADTTEVTVNVNPSITASIAGELEICAGGSTTLTASGGSSFLWSILGSPLADTTAAITVSPLVTTTYTVVALNGTCADTTEVTVTVNPSITAAIAGELEICAGGSTTLTASGGSSFLWSILGSPLADTTASITVSPLETTTYTLVALNGTCADTTEVTVNVAPSITAAIAGELEICAGGSTTLTASGGSSFLWSILGSPLADTTASITVSPLETTTYTLIALNGTCADTTEVTVNVAPSITAAIAGELEICAGGSTTLTATGGSSFLWSVLGGALTDTTASITVSPLVTTTYTLVALNGTCADTTEVTVTVNPSITATIAGELEICAGGSTTLTASGGSSFLWSVLGNPLADTTAAITVSPLVTTTYTLIALNGTCADTTEVTVTVAPSITAAIAGELEICAGGSTTLTASGGSSFLWSILGNPLTDTTASITVSPLVTTTYTVVALNGTCADTTEVTVTVAPSITAAIAGELEICAGGSTTLTASGGSSFLWSILGSPLADTTASITVSPLETTTYTLIALNGTCADTTEVTVNVAPSITAAIAGELEICAGGSTTLTATGGSSFLWSVLGGALTDTTASITVSPLVTTTYTLVALNGTCADTTEVTVTVNPSITATIAGELEICAGGSTTLTASGGSSFLWSVLGGALTDTTASITVSPLVTTTYTLVALNGTCADTTEVTVTVNPSITATIAGELEICAGGSTTLTASGGSSFLWSALGNPLADTTAAITVSPLVTTTYTLVALNGTCADTTEVTVTVNPSITAAIAGELEICAGGSTTLTASGGSSFLWSVLGSPLADTTASITVSPLVTTTYTLVALNGTCADTTEVTVTVNPSITATIAGELEICAGGSTTLTASGGSSFLWSILGNPLADTTASITVSPLETTTYTVVALNGTCSDTTEVTVTVAPAIVAGLLTDCSNNNTGNDNSDDTYTFTVNPTGGGGTTYSITGEVVASNIPYGTAYTSASFLISGGVKNITITDDQTGCTAQVVVVPPTSCSSCPPVACIPVVITILRNSR